MTSSFSCPEKRLAEGVLSRLFETPRFGKTYPKYQKSCLLGCLRKALGCRMGAPRVIAAARLDLRSKKLRGCLGQGGKGSKAVVPPAGPWFAKVSELRRAASAAIRSDPVCTASLSYSMPRRCSGQ